VSPRAVAEFLNFAYVPDPETIYEDVRRLEAGGRMTVGLAGSPRRSQYWKPSFELEPAADFEKAAARVDEMSAAAVRGQLVSDVPLGAFLSGGVDSSTVVAHMARQAPERVKTFSIGFTNKEYDELEYARMTAGRYQTAHSEEVVTPRVEEMLAVLVRQYDEPFGDSSAIPTLYLARMTRRQVTVALSGDGADEVFGGYRRYVMALHEERARRKLPRWFRRALVRPLAKVYPKLDFLPRFLRAKATLTGISLTHAESYFLAMSRFGDGGLEEVLSPEIRAQLGGFSAMESYTDRFRPWAGLEPLRQLQAVDFQTYLPGDILVKVDRATMAYSLESRAPWLDHRLAGFACSLPGEFHVSGHNGKRLFKSVASRYIDAPILDRPKMGFTVPLAEWFRTSLRGLFEREVLAPGMDALLNQAAVRRLWGQHQRGTRNHDMKLWNLLMLACWRHTHVEGRAVAEVTRIAD
jgi:asparagine synthase (glutamine-hydrolysing)